MCADGLYCLVDFFRFFFLLTRLNYPYFSSAHASLAMYLLNCLEPNGTQVEHVHAARVESSYLGTVK
jgi:hypothetical protein